MALTSEHANFIARARTATLGTIADDGRPRLVPICFVLDGDVLVTPIDEKPKNATDPRQLARIRDIERRADVTVLVDRWDEDWHHLAWLRIDGRASAPRIERLLAEHLPARRRAIRTEASPRNTG